MTTTGMYSVSELARLSGVTVRTLHHYDHVGLLVPSERSDAGYRLYSPEDVERLARIVVYRSTGMSLPAIASALAASGTDRAELLREQITLLDQRIALLSTGRALLTRAWEAQKMGINLNPEEIFEVFGEHDPLQYADEAEERWGETDAYRESHRRTSSYTKEDWKRLGEASERVEAEFAACMEEGLPADSPRAKAAAEMHRRHIDTWFYPCGHEMQANLAEMYVADERFRAHYDDRRPGLAEYVRDAILANAIDRIA